MSDTESSRAITRSRRNALRWNQATDSWRFSNSRRSSRGCPTHALSVRPPMEVLDRSRTDSRDAEVSPQRPPSKSSRLRRVCGSRIMCRSVE